MKRKRETLPTEPPARRAEALLVRLKSMADPVAREGMARFGIRTENALGISVKGLRAVVKETGKDTETALELLRTSSCHEAHLLASFSCGRRNSRASNWTR